MITLMTHDEIIKQVENYTSPNYMWINIWQITAYEIQLVLTISHEDLCRLGDHKVLRLNSLLTDEESVDVIKDRGREVKKLLKRHFKNSEIHSNLHYR